MAPPPLFRQGKSDNCALACLRMILGHHGIDVDEATLEEAGAKQPGGVFIEDLVRLANHYGLNAETAALTLDGLAEWVAKGVYPIVYLNRIHCDKRFPVARKLALRQCVVHAVIPVGLSTQFVWFNDPLPGKRRRISRKKFEAAQSDLSNWCVICRPG